MEWEQLRYLYMIASSRKESVKTLKVTMKKIITKVLLVIAVIFFCYIFAVQTPFWVESTEEKLSTMSTEDVELTIIDEETVQLENLIKLNGATYTWIIKNYRNGSSIYGSDQLALAESDVIEFYCDTPEKLTIQAVVIYDNVEYTSTKFQVESDGTVVLQSEEEDTSSIDTTEDITRDISDIVSLAYIGFLLAMVVLYYIVPKRIQWIVLLLASVFFYTLSGIQYIVFILASAIITFWTARKMSAKKVLADQKMKEAPSVKVRKAMKAELQKENRQYLWTALIGTLGVMAVIKYSAFVLSNMNGLFNMSIPIIALLMPLGLSFYTFMLIAYAVDVYRGKYVAEENFGRFFLFISFFPHVSQGPISRYDEVAPQLREYKSLDMNNLCLAAQRILWGFFVKLVLADRIAIFVSAVYDGYESYSWFMLIVASIAYSVQVYADFYSSMEIAIGSAQAFGINLGENFLRPYFATNMPDFWRRWHVTLGTWFKEYVFYPISISKRVMKLSVDTRKKYGANAARILASIPPIMGVWILTGLWHGSSWKFVAWGLFHGMLILLSTAFSQNVQSGLKKIGIKTESWDYKVLQMVKVFMLCTIGRVFFRAGSLTIALKIFWNIITFSNPSSFIELSTIALEAIDYKIIIVATLLLLLVSIIQEKVGSVRTEIGKLNIWIRWTIWLCLIMAVLILGVYGPGTTPVFIYDAF